MPSFSGLLIVVAIAFAAPFLLGFFPGVKLPAVVLEILAGIVVGPSVLGFSAYARNCGAFGIRVDERGQLDQALAEAVAHDGPSMVEVIADPNLV